MALTSRIGEAQDALEAIITAQNPLDSRGQKVPISVGWPDGGPEPEHIWVDGAVEDWTERQAISGPMEIADREEKFTLIVVILVAQKDSYKQARDRLLVLAGEVEEALRTSFTLQNEVWEAELTGGRIGEEVGEDGRRAMATLNVGVTAYLAG